VGANGAFTPKEQQAVSSEFGTIHSQPWLSTSPFVDSFHVADNTARKRVCHVRYEGIIIYSILRKVKIGKTSAGFPLRISVAPQVTGIHNNGGADTGARDRREQRYLQRD
jgi:hypothetical protein